MGILDFLKPSNELPAKAEREIAESGPEAGELVPLPLLDPEHTDELIRDEGLEVYRRMIRDDPQVKAALFFKRLGILSSGWEIQPGDESDEQVELAEFVTSVLENIPGTFDKVLYNILDGLVDGFSVNEKVWSPIESGDWSGLNGYSKIASRPAETFGFKTDRHGNLLPNGLIQFPDEPMKRMELPIDKFIIWSYQKRAGNYYGESDLRPAYRHWFAKDMAGRAWNIALERYADPVVIGLMKTNLSAKVKTAFKAIVENIRGKSGILLDANTQEIKYLERQGANPTLGYERATIYHDKMITRAFLLADLIFGEGTRTGSMALGKVHLETLTWVMTHQTNELACVVNDQGIRPLVDMNFDVELYPKIQFNPFTDAAMESLLERFKSMIDSEIIEPSEPFVREDLNLPPKEGTPNEESSNTEENDSDLESS